jgi:uncharacterized integral membrane protein
MFKSVIIWLKRIFLLLWGLVILFFSANITQDNPGVVHLHLLGSSFSASAGFVLMGSLGAGILIGVGLLLPNLYLCRARYRRLVAKSAASSLKPSVQSDPIP